MLPLTTTTMLFAATWLVFGAVAVVLWRRTAGAIEREDALRISMETMLMRSRFRDTPPVSRSVLEHADPARLAVHLDEDGEESAGDGERTLDEPETAGR